MLTRFCLYGFLKNQRYFEPFLVLALLGRGLDFFAIGTLVAIGAVTTNLLEVASGALADTWGRRRSMLVSLTAYVGAFGLLGVGQTFATLAPAMVLYGVGEAFRSGTHKAMILTWLRLQGRESERTRVYGTTRSWSKLGSALSVVIGATWVVVTGDMDALFLLAIVPYFAGLANIASYPPELDGERAAELSVRATWEHMVGSLREVVRSRLLRGLVLESSAFMGVFTSTKDYLQPVLQAAAGVWLVGLGALVGEGGVDGDEARTTALLVGPVYFCLFLLSAAGSRNSDRFARRFVSSDQASVRLWVLFALSFGLVLLGSATPWGVGLVIVAFVALHAMEAVWRPIMISRFDDAGPEHQGATLLSIESQAHSISTMVLAPVVGALMDRVTAHAEASPGFVPMWWPIGVLGVLVGVTFWRRGVREFGRGDSERRA